MTTRDDFLALDPGGAELTVRATCGGSRIQIRWRARGRSGVVEADSYASAMAEAIDAASAPSAPAVAGFFNRGDFIGRI